MMQIQPPIVSVIIPVYNVEAYIAATLESVLQQTFQDFEIIVIDDASPDGSIEIVKRFSDPRIRIIHQKNRGLAGARNTGIREAKGQIIALLDSDDLWHAQKLEKHVAHLNMASHVGVSYSRSEFIDESGQSLGTYTMPKLHNITIQDLFLNNPVGNGSAPVIRKAVLDEIAYSEGSERWFFDEHFRQAEDIECWARVALNTQWTFEGLADPLTLYRVNTQSLSGNFIKQHEAMLTVLEKTATYAPDFVAKQGSLIKACNARYLSRSAIRMRNPKMAVQLIHQAFAYDGRVLFQNPRNTLMILITAYLYKYCPSSWQQSIERLIQSLSGSLQKRKLDPQPQQNPQPVS